MLDRELLTKLAGYTSLYAEDECDVRENTSKILKNIFKTVYVAKNGSEAFEIFEEKKPDLIITDIKMPKLNGLELIEKVHKINPKTRVIVLSAHTNLDYLLKATELHMVKYIVKPLNEDKLKEALHSFLNSFSNQKIHTITSDLIFDESRSLIRYKDENICLLTKKEAVFLKLLITKQRIITYEEIQTFIWDSSEMTQNALRLFVRNLRKKIPVKLIQNVQNTGYQLLS